MSNSQLVDVQLLREGAPVGDRYVSEVDPTDPADRTGLFYDAVTHAQAEAPRHRIVVYRRNTNEELFTHPVPPATAPERLGGVETIPRRKV